MRIVKPAAIISISVLSALAASTAFGQSSYRPLVTSQQAVPASLAGAGGRGGSGAGAEGMPGGVVVREAEFANRAPSYVTHVRTSRPPPLDPSRLIYEADCTRPFEYLGKGNLQCM